MRMAAVARALAARFVAGPGEGSACPRNPHRRGHRMSLDLALGWHQLSSSAPA